MMSRLARPISGARGRPPRAASCSGPLLAKRSSRPAGLRHTGAEAGAVSSAARTLRPCRLAFYREFAACPSLSFSFTSSTCVLHALRPDAFNTRWDRHQANSESSSPLYRGKGQKHLLSAFYVQMGLHGQLVYFQQPCEGGSSMPT